MPRHPRIALTSRLRVHTTNDNAGLNCFNQNSAEQQSRSILVRIIISARIRAHDRSGQTRSRHPVPASVAARKLKPKPSRHRFEKPIHNVKKLAAPGSRDTAAWQRISVLHHLDNGGAIRKAFQRLDPQGPPSFRRRMVEPIGIEPMTSSLQS